ncbi:hypothetical protein LINPERHAP1_LOCUS20417 [Linum perenne]
MSIMNRPSSGPGYKPFGGKTVLLGGDFRQTLPVVSEAGREESLDASLTRSYLWPFCHVLHLSQNMRIKESEVNHKDIFEGKDFSEWVLAMGNGTLPSTTFPDSTSPDWIKIPDLFLINPNNDPYGAIIHDIYSNFLKSYSDIAYIKNRAIVTPTNQVVSDINARMLAEVPGEVRTYYSSDKLCSDNANSASLEVDYPPEFLNSLSLNGLPEHEIMLKPFTPIMLLRNLNPSAGLFNGTRIMITHLGENVIKGTIMVAHWKDQWWQSQESY